MTAPDELAEFYVHTAAVTQYLGSGAYGPTYAAPVTIPCYIDAQQVLTLTGSGEQVTQRQTVLYCALEHGALLAPLSKVTSTQLGGDGVAKVATCNLLDAGNLDLPNHVEAQLI